MDELKPCPFCGGKAYIDQYAGHYHKNPSLEVGCESCEFRLGTVSKDREILVDLWNRRAPPAFDEAKEREAACYEFVALDEPLAFSITREVFIEGWLARARKA